MTAQNSARAKITSFHKSVTGNGILGVMRAGGVKTTLIADEKTEGVLVDSNKLDSELTKGGVNASKKVKEFEVKKNNAAATVDQAQMDMVGLENNKNYKKTIGEDIFGDEDVVGGPSVTKYSAADPIG